MTLEQPNQVQQGSLKIVGTVDTSTTMPIIKTTTVVQELPKTGTNFQSDMLLSGIGFMLLVVVGLLFIQYFNTKKSYQ